jgi:hypothetical protein
MTTRRRFVSLLSLAPLAGVSLLAASGEKAPPAASAPSPAPAPAPAQPAAPPVAATPAPAVASAPAATPTPTPAPTVVAPDEQLAASLGYVTDATQVDPSKYPAFVAGRNCSQCALYSGAAGEANGPCSIFNGRLVSAQGWCSVWAKRA